MLRPSRYAFSRLDPGAPVPEWFGAGEFSTLSRTPDELSICCEEARVPRDVRSERGFRLLRLMGPIDFSEVGVIAGIAGPLAAAGISLVPIGTFDTDYILVREADLNRAVAVLRTAGYTVHDH